MVTLGTRCSKCTYIIKISGTGLLSVLVNIIINILLLPLTMPTDLLYYFIICKSFLSFLFNILVII